MLNGRLSIDCADNGWILKWTDPSPSFTQHCWVSADPDVTLSRIVELAGIFSGAPAARMLLDMAESRGHVDPATDPDVADVAAPGTPPTVPIGD